MEVGHALAQLEEKKRLAVANEDYDTAKALKGEVTGPSGATVCTESYMLIPEATGTLPLSLAAHLFCVEERNTVRIQPHASAFRRTLQHSAEHALGARRWNAYGRPWKPRATFPARAPALYARKQAQTLSSSRCARLRAVGQACLVIWNKDA